MRLIWIACVVLAVGVLATENLAFQSEEDSNIGSPQRNALLKLFTVHNTAIWGSNERVKRSMKEEIEKGFKDFSDKISKLPEQLSTNMKKFFEDRGISMENIQKILNEIMNAVENLINEVRKAL